jgi:hypothetical protein
MYRVDFTFFSTHLGFLLDKRLEVNEILVKPHYLFTCCLLIYLESKRKKNCISLFCFSSAYEESDMCPLYYFFVFTEKKDNIFSFCSFSFVKYIIVRVCMQDIFSYLLFMKSVVERVLFHYFSAA